MRAVPAKLVTFLMGQEATLGEGAACSKGIKRALKSATQSLSKWELSTFDDCNGKPGFGSAHSIQIAKA
jgi:hypothetical protein